MRQKIDEKKMLTICIAGKNNLAVDILEFLHKKQGQYELCVICNERRKEIIGWQKSLERYAMENGIKQCTLEEIYLVPNLLFLSLEFDKIIKPIKFKDARLYNIHFSLLPAYKGMYTSAVPILNGEKTVGVTLHRIDEGIDTGDIIDQVSFDIEQEDTARDLYDKYMKNGTKLVIKNLEKLIENKEEAYRQPYEGASYYSKDVIDYSNLKINLNTTAEQISRQIKAFSFREYQMPKVNGYEIIESEITHIKSKAKPGTVIVDNQSSILAATIDYNIILYKDRFNELLENCKEGNLQGVMDVCTCKRHINVQNERGWTPLIVATYYGHKEIVKWLIANGADIEITNYNGTNLLMYAKESYIKSGDAELFALYRKLGLNIYEADNYGMNVLDYIKKDGLAELNAICMM